MDDFLDSSDAFLLTMLCGFLVGFIYMVELHLLVDCSAWLSVFFFYAVLVFGGFFAFVKSSQCSGVGICVPSQTMVVGGMRTSGSSS